jgi:hypothetical protein
MEFPSNSHKVTEGTPNPSRATGAKKETERVPLEKAVTGEVIHKKKGLKKRFKEVFLGADAKGTTTYILVEVLVPAFRNMVFDAAQNGIQRFIYGDTVRRHPSPGRGRTQYNSPVSRGLSSMMDRRPTMLPDQPPRHSAQDRGDIILSSNEDAASVLSRLIEIVDQYGLASVADLHDLVGLPTTYIDNKWGWVDLKYSKVRQVRDGFILELPPIEPID